MNLKYLSLYVRSYRVSVYIFYLDGYQTVSLHSECSHCVALCWEVGWMLPSVKRLHGAGCLGGSSGQRGGSRWASEALVSPHLRVSLCGKLTAGTGKMTRIFPTLGLFVTFTQVEKEKKANQGPLSRSSPTCTLRAGSPFSPHLHRFSP